MYHGAILQRKTGAAAWVFLHPQLLSQLCEGAGPPPGAALRAFVSHHSAAMQRAAAALRAGDSADAGIHRDTAFRALAAELAAAAEAALAAEGRPLVGVSTDRSPGPASGGSSAGSARAEDQEQGGEEAAVEGGASGRGAATGGRLDAGAGAAAAARWLVACADPGYAHSLELCGRWAQALERRLSVHSLVHLSICSLPQALITRWR